MDKKIISVLMIFLILLSNIPATFGQEKCLVVSVVIDNTLEPIVKYSIDSKITQNQFQDFISNSKRALESASAKQEEKQKIALLNMIMLTQVTDLTLDTQTVNDLIDMFSLLSDEQKLNNAIQSYVKELTERRTNNLDAVAITLLDFLQEGNIDLETLISAQEDLFMELVEEQIETKEKSILDAPALTRNAEGNYVFENKNLLLDNLKLLGQGVSGKTYDARIGNNAAVIKVSLEDPATVLEEGRKAKKLSDLGLDVAEFKGYFEENGEKIGIVEEKILDTTLVSFLQNVQRFKDFVEEVEINEEIKQKIQSMDKQARKDFFNTELLTLLRLTENENKLESYKYLVEEMPLKIYDDIGKETALLELAKTVADSTMQFWKNGAAHGDVENFMNIFVNIDENDNFNAKFIDFGFTELRDEDEDKFSVALRNDIIGLNKLFGEIEFYVSPYDLDPIVTNVQDVYTQIRDNQKTLEQKVQTEESLLTSDKFGKIQEDEWTVLYEKEIEGETKPIRFLKNDLEDLILENFYDNKDKLEGAGWFSELKKRDTPQSSSFWEDAIQPVLEKDKKTFLETIKNDIYVRTFLLLAFAENNVLENIVWSLSNQPDVVDITYDPVLGWGAVYENLETAKTESDFDLMNYYEDYEVPKEPTSSKFISTPALEKIIETHDKFELKGNNHIDEFALMGEGAFGKVYSALIDGKEVVIKVPHKKGYYGLFEEEARKAKKLREELGIENVMGYIGEFYEEGFPRGFIYEKVGDITLKGLLDTVSEAKQSLNLVQDKDALKRVINPGNGEVANIIIDNLDTDITDIFTDLTQKIVDSFIESWWNKGAAHGDFSSHLNNIMLIENNGKIEPVFIDVGLSALKNENKQSFSNAVESDIRGLQLFFSKLKELNLVSDDDLNIMRMQVDDAIQSIAEQLEKESTQEIQPRIIIEETFMPDEFGKIKEDEWTVLYEKKIEGEKKPVRFLNNGLEDLLLRESYETYKEGELTKLLQTTEEGQKFSTKYATPAFRNEESFSSFLDNDYHQAFFFKYFKNQNVLEKMIYSLADQYDLFYDPTLGIGIVYDDMDTALTQEPDFDLKRAMSYPLQKYESFKEKYETKAPLKDTALTLVKNDDGNYVLTDETLTIDEIKPLGFGGSAKVYTAKIDGKDVIIKISNRNYIGLLEKEADATKKLTDMGFTNVMKYDGMFEEKGNIKGFVAEFVDGLSLRRVLKEMRQFKKEVQNRKQKITQSITEEEKIRYLKKGFESDYISNAKISSRLKQFYRLLIDDIGKDQLPLTLMNSYVDSVTDFWKKGVAHGDLSHLGNVFVTVENNEFKLKFIDFEFTEFKKDDQKNFNRAVKRDSLGLTQIFINNDLNREGMNNFYEFLSEEDKLKYKQEIRKKVAEIQQISVQVQATEPKEPTTVDVSKVKIIIPEGEADETQPMTFMGGFGGGFGALGFATPAITPLATTAVGLGLFLYDLVSVRKEVEEQGEKIGFFDVKKQMKFYWGKWKQRFNKLLGREQIPLVEEMDMLEAPVLELETEEDLPERGEVEQIKEGAFEKEITQGKTIIKSIDDFKQASSSLEGYDGLEQELYETAIKDKYGADKLPVFENKLINSKYVLYEFSMSRDSMKELNDISYTLGTEAITAQHNVLVEFAKENNLPVSTLQKAGFLAVPEDSGISDEQIQDLKSNLEKGIENVLIIEGVLKKSKETKDEETTDEMPVKINIGSADVASEDSLIFGRLKTKRSLEYEKNTGNADRYDQDVKDWYDDLTLEEKVAVNDIFRGYDSALLNDFKELELLNSKSELTQDEIARYETILETLVKTDMQDKEFSAISVVKAYLSDDLTGIKEGELVFETDGIGLGQKNKADVERLTKELENKEITEKEFAEQLGIKIDNNIALVNEQIRQVHDVAVDNIKTASNQIIAEYNQIAKEAGFRELKNVDDLKEFLKYEFKNYGRFRGGDESFFAIRKIVIDTNPNIENLIQDAIRQCGESCEFEVRIGTKVVGVGESFKSAVAKADTAVQQSKTRFFNAPVRINEKGDSEVRQVYVQETEPTTTQITESEFFQQLIEFENDNGFTANFLGLGSLWNFVTKNFKKRPIITITVGAVLLSIAGVTPYVTGPLAITGLGLTHLKMTWKIMSAPFTFPFKLLFGKTTRKYTIGTAAVITMLNLPSPIKEISLFSAAAIYSFKLAKKIYNVFNKLPVEEQEKAVMEITDLGNFATLTEEEAEQMLIQRGVLKETQKIGVSGIRKTEKVFEIEEEDEILLSQDQIGELVTRFERDLKLDEDGTGNILRMDLFGFGVLYDFMRTTGIPFIKQTYTKLFSAKPQQIIIDNSLFVSEIRLAKTSLPEIPVEMREETIYPLEQEILDEEKVRMFRNATSEDDFIETLAKIAKQEQEKGIMPEQTIIQLLDELKAKQIGPLIEEETITFYYGKEPRTISKQDLINIIIQKVPTTKITKEYTDKLKQLEEELIDFEKQSQNKEFLEEIQKSSTQGKFFGKQGMLYRPDGESFFEKQTNIIVTEESLRCEQGEKRDCYPANENTLNVGVCRAGLQECVELDLWGSCKGAITPTHEICDGLDNDCDGEVDENLDKYCYTGDSETENIGVCRAGLRQCIGGEWTECRGEILPTEEICNLQDDNCNHIVDDNCKETITPFDKLAKYIFPEYTSEEEPQEGDKRYCYSASFETLDVGICRAGTQTFENGKWTDCIGEITPYAEQCNNQDDNCDGEVDNIERLCYDGEQKTDMVGLCQRGIQVCTQGEWSECYDQVIPTKEICDGYDNDCDGKIDDGCILVWKDENFLIDEEEFYPCDDQMSSSVACCWSTKGTTTEPVKTYDFELYEKYIPEGFEIVSQPFAADCDKDYVDITSSIPDTYDEVYLMRCRDGEENACEPLFIPEIIPHDGLTCYGYDVDSFAGKETEVKDYINPLQDNDVNLVEKSFVMPGEIEYKNAKIILPEITARTTIVVKDIENRIAYPLNNNLELTAGPIVVKAKEAQQLTLPVNIDMNYLTALGIDDQTINAYAITNKGWKKLETTIDAEANHAFVNIENIYPIMNEHNEATIAFFGIKSETKDKPIFKQTYSGTEKDTIVLVPGLGGRADSFSSFIEEMRLTKQPQQIWTYEYPVEYDVDLAASPLARQIISNKELFENITFIGFSAGSLILQEALHQAERMDDGFVDKTQKVILIAGPNEGTPIINVYDNLLNYLTNYKTYAELFELNEEMAKDLLEGRIVPRLEGPKYYVLAGDESYDFNLGYFTVSTEELFDYQPNDGIVSVKSAQRVGNEYIYNSCDNYFELPLTHTEMNDHELARETIGYVINKEKQPKIEQPLLGQNQYARYPLFECKTGDVYYLIGKAIDDEMKSSVANCACGNGMCGIDETELSCPQDCAKAKSWVEPKVLYFGALTAVLVLIGFLIYYIRRKKKKLKF